LLIQNSALSIIYVTLYFNILHNYFIMHDIKYFFLIKIIRQVRGDKKIFRRDKLPKTSSKNTIFQNPGARAPLDHLGSAPVQKELEDLDSRLVHKCQLGFSFVIIHL
jgi:hypothetical protein